MSRFYWGGIGVVRVLVVSNGVGIYGGGRDDSSSEVVELNYYENDI